MLRIAALTLIAFLNAPPGSSDEQIAYEVAYRKARDEKKPLVVLVGANWCAACKTMKVETMQPMRGSGALKEVVYTQVDKDLQPEIAQQLMQGNTLPQIVVYCESEQGWKRFSLTGIQTEGRVKELIRKAADVIPTVRR